MTDSIREPKPEPTQNAELNAVLEYLEALLLESHSSLLESLRQLFQTPAQRFWKGIDQAAKEIPDLIWQANHLSSIASQQTLSSFKAYLETECDRQMNAHKRFMGACVGIALSGGICILITEVYLAIATLKGLSSLDAGLLSAAFPTLAAVGLSILMVYALIRISITRRVISSYHRWVHLLEIATYSKSCK